MYMNPRCIGCREPIRSEDDWTRNDQGQFIHADCEEEFIEVALPVDNRLTYEPPYSVI